MDAIKTVMEEQKEKPKTPLKNGGKLTKIERAECIKFMLRQMAKGTTYMDRLQNFQDEFCATISQAKTYDTEAIKALNEWQCKDVSSIRSVQNARLETILSEAMARNDRKTALQAIDLMNKMYGVYQAKPEVVVAPIMQFKFGNDPNEEITIIDNNIDNE